MWCLHALSPGQMRLGQRRLRRAAPRPASAVASRAGAVPLGANTMSVPLPLSGGRGDVLPPGRVQATGPTLAHWETTACLGWRETCLCPALEPSPPPSHALSMLPTSPGCRSCHQGGTCGLQTLGPRALSRCLSSFQLLFWNEQSAFATSISTRPRAAADGPRGGAVEAPGLLVPPPFVTEAGMVWRPRLPPGSRLGPLGQPSFLGKVVGSLGIKGCLWVAFCTPHGAWWPPGSPRVRGPSVPWFSLHHRGCNSQGLLSLSSVGWPASPAVHSNTPSGQPGAAAAS